MKKKLVPILLALALTVAAVGCAGDNAPTADNSPVESGTPETSQTTSPEQDKEKSPTPEVSDIPSMEDILPPPEDEVEEVPEIPMQDMFTDVRETVYATSTVNIRSQASASSTKLGQLKTAEAILRTGVGTGEAAGWSEVVLTDGTVAYINSSYLSTTKPATQQTSNSSNPSNPGNSGSSNQGSSGNSGNSGSSMDADGDGFPDSWQMEDPGNSGGGGSSDHTDEEIDPNKVGGPDTEGIDYSGITIG